MDLRVCWTTEGLTEDAVSARLFSGGLAPPLYLHSSMPARQDSRTPVWESRLRQLFHSQVGKPMFRSGPEAFLLNLAGGVGCIFDAR